MKKYLLFIIMHTSFCCLAQEKKTIAGSFVDYNKADTLLFFNKYVPKSYFQESDYEVFNNKGHFTLENKFEFPQLYFSLLASERGRLVSRPKLFFFDENTKAITIDYNRWEASLTDGRTATEYEKSFLPQAFIYLDISDEEALISILYGKFNKLDTLLYDYTKDNPKSFVSLWMLAYRFHLLGFSKIGEGTLSLFDESVKKSVVWAALDHDFKNAHIKEGNEFPNIPVENLSGERVDLVLPKGKLILVDFWFSFCQPCIASIPKLKSLYDAYKPYGFDIVAISIDPEPTKNKWKGVIADKNMSWSHFVDPGGKETMAMKINSFPRYLLLDEEGKIMQTDIDLSTLEDILKNRLSKQ
ncbi:TlpA disulfide reductase family protein [Sphingobacterium oryzagri]|uniref:TlpA disulfide reductase family protein n=1 Tax=Sphingobacterium oryzagri TaxID=3025669 RepID=A0ABY7WGI4_9SPHI|nr:TlpA disulfide reductase family protein [Sphingobacterium sp. KACC 22765]WDF67631.1 TlpA disulfide reductase family protein [Sphingobacterium sp. KACC 22765]